MIKRALLIALSSQVASASEDIKDLFNKFKIEFKKTYRDISEETKRLEIFSTNLQLIRERNTQEIAIGGKAVHGITKFSDLTQEEFVRRYLTAKPSSNFASSLNATDAPEFPAMPADTLVDWTGVYTTDVKDQGKKKTGLSIIKLCCCVTLLHYLNSDFCFICEPIQYLIYIYL